MRLLKKRIQMGQGKKTPYPRNASLPQLFEEEVKKGPNRIAIRYLNKQLTYRQLNAQANQFARFLMKKGVQKGDLVGVAIPRSIEFVIAALALLKIGAAYVPSLPQYPAMKFTITPDLLKKKGNLSTANLKRKVRPLDLAVVHFTSGSTGVPKGVKICHRGIIRHVKQGGYFEPSAKERTLHIARVTFDAATIEIWATLLNGATLCIFPQTKFSVDELGRFIKKEKITHALLTARLFNLLIDNQIHHLKSLRYLGSVGEAMSAIHAKRAFEALPKCQIVNGYGPTENTACTTAYVVKNVQKIKEMVPIGRPLNNSYVYVLDEKQKLVPIGKTGELYAGGDGVALGYLNQEALTREKFISDPFSKDPEARLYRTGDLVRYLKDGNLVFLGRRDAQVKISGFRIELDGIEEVFRKLPNVADCAAVVKEERLAVYVEPKKGKPLDPEHLRESAAKILPDYSIPSFIFVLKHLPLNQNGKVDRKALPSPAELHQAETQHHDASKLEKQIGAIWKDLLKNPSIGPESHFFRVGGDSILAMKLHSRMKQAFGLEIPVHLIFEASTLRQYAQKIDDLKTGRIGEAVEPFWVWRHKEEILDPSIVVSGGCTSRQYRRPSLIFLTGATGLVGSFFLKELLETTEAQIACLVRAKNEKEAFSRLIEIFEKYLIWKPEYRKRILPIVGDLEKPLLGISPQQFAKLSDTVDSVFHVGAFVNHAMSYERHKAANVLGTQEAIRLAANKKTKPFHFVSTVSVFIDEKDLANGYAQSKCVAESLVLIARSRGLPCNMYRLPRISGDTEVGSGPTTDFLWRLIQASCRLGKTPKTDLYDDLAPVNYVCRAIHLLSQKPNQINADYSVVSPYRVSYSTLFKYLQRLGYPLELMNAEKWRKLLVDTAIQTGEKELEALAALLAEQDLTTPVQIVRFSTKKLEAAVGLKCPKVDERLFKKYIDYYVKIGFLPPY